MASFRVTVAYDGTEFVGWQRQASGVSIQGLLEDALRVLDGRDVAVAGAGRTDAGVHAAGQSASFTLARTITPETLLRAINIRLPPAVRLLDAQEVPPTFHARFDADSKTYRYRIWNADALDPFERLYAWHIPERLDVAAMDRAARLLEGEHDFAAFQSGGSDVATTVRTVLASRVTQQGVALITYEVIGTGFLRHMVRAIAGTLVDIGRGRQHPDWIGEVLVSKARAAAGRTAPASGLFLMQVGYGGSLAAEP